LEADLPSLSAPNQVLIQVHYVELNPVDLQKLNAKPGQPVPNPPLIVGYGGSGVVMETSSDMFEKGDEVAFLGDPSRRGALATHVVADAPCVAKIPSEISMATAATLPLAGCTAYESLEKLTLESAENLLIVGGSGGVGSWATLLAKAKYPEIKVLCTASSSESQTWCADNGAQQVFSHDDILKHLEGGRYGSVDRILCLTEPTPELWQALTEVIRPYGIICLVVAGTSIGSLDLGFCFFKSVTVTTETVFCSQRTNYSHRVPASEMEHMLQLLQEGKIARVPAKGNPVSWNNSLDGPGILDQLASGHTQGKLVMKID
jgi:NADPH:quinone reductase-like Zn-dependent oxidoreductase